ncbi:guanylate-binding protein 3-like [Chenopodium quinoa]|uniref:guanylate-binding protein 3-like n=1 Tax=Chenopodium quinoa TaxID=63459 RepID=UPI000B793547|nr:guanylate-binding protein 3-like [Chenopodium quinoa]
MMQRLFRGGSVSAAKDNGDSLPETPSPASRSPVSDFQSPSSSSPAPAVTGPARPIRFLYCDEKGKFRLDPEALAVLQLVKEPIGVVSVCGRARQGKSFILNQLLGRSSGFQVASTHKPCTKGLWLWSVPLKRTALDGTEYNLILLDSEGIDAYDQTGTYSTQIFSLAVLLSSMFIYNQMGGIDEAALDRLSLVTEMTKHIRVRASGGKTSASELGQFSPIFVWLLRDFYLDLTEDNRKITPRDYLELALRPVQGGAKDVSAKNEIRESIRALFPDRECFTLVRPLNNESQLQRMDQLSLNKLRPEFKSGLDALTRFVFERTRPKQMGATTMNGPMLAGITQSFLDALNHGAVPTITSSWQSVEESECRRAYDSATEEYMSSFDRSKPAEEAALREAHEVAVQKALGIFNACAVGAGPVRQKFEKLLQTFFKKVFEDYKRNAYMEAEMKCLNAIQNMEKRLRAACHSADAKLEQVFKILDDLCSEFEKSTYGPEKWHRLANFLLQSLEGPIADLVRKKIDQVTSEKSSLSLKCRSIEDKMNMLNKQLEANEKSKSEYMKRYEDAINEKKKVADEYMSHITSLQSKCSSLEEKSSGLLKSLESVRQESSDWKRKYEYVLSKKKDEEEQASADRDALKSRTSAAEARLAAAREQVQSSQEEADEWKRKYDIAVRETKAALEKAAVVQERADKTRQSREDTIRSEFSSSLAKKEEEIKKQAANIEHAEQRLAALSFELKAAESKVASYELQIAGMRSDIKELNEKLDAANATAQSYEREASTLEQEKVHLEQKYQSEFKRFDEVQERCRIAEKEAKRATEVADKARLDAAAAQKEKNEIQRTAMERLAHIERAERQIDHLEREKSDLANELETLRTSETDANAKVSLLEAQVEERQKEIELLMKSNSEQRASTVQVLESLLETERVARGEANRRAEALSHQLQATQAKLDMVQQELTSVCLNESALDAKLKSASHGKRARVDEHDVAVDSAEDMDVDKARVSKRRKSTISPLQQAASAGDCDSVFTGDDDESSQQNDTQDYRKFTIQKLKQELTEHNFGDEVFKLRAPAKKKDYIALYEKYILNKS